ncbi:hypothetical protein D3C84_739200 [compost metagenome]
MFADALQRHAQAPGRIVAGGGQRAGGDENAGFAGQGRPGRTDVAQLAGVVAVAQARLGLDAQHIADDLIVFTQWPRHHRGPGEAQAYQAVVTRGLVDAECGAGIALCLAEPFGAHRVAIEGQ